MEKDSSFHCHLEVSAHMYIVFKTTLLNMMEKQQGQISRNLSSTYFTGQDQAPRKFIFLEVRGQNLSRSNSITP